ncbi:cytochrome c oxidase subunit II [Natronorarus salvus]|uniref:cytochrome c oxidase subunit II n=1 Tax=Natronorarus salvus TaxID=3117733 RepID=UPI002F26767E
MERKRLALVAAGFTAFALLVAQPVAAYNSVNDQLIGDLNMALLYAAIPITLLVEGILIYTVLKYRNNDDPQPTRENRRLEITWTITTAIVLLFVGLASYQVMADPFITQPPGEEGPVEGDEEAIVIEVEAYNYGWDFHYEDEDVTSTGEAVIPAGQEVYFDVTADHDRGSWIHGFHVPDLGLKQDAVPDQHNMVATEVYEEGEYQGYCAKYCGTGHSQMNFIIDVVDDDEYEEWLEEQAEGDDEEDDEAEDEENGEDADDEETEE